MDTSIELMGEEPTKEHKILWNGKFLDGTLTVFLSKSQEKGYAGGTKVLYVMSAFDIYDKGYGFIQLSNPASMPEFMKLIETQYLQLVLQQKKLEEQDGNSVYH